MTCLKIIKDFAMVAFTPLLRCLVSSNHSSASCFVIIAGSVSLVMFSYCCSVILSVCVLAAIIVYNSSVFKILLFSVWI